MDQLSIALPYLHIATILLLAGLFLLRTYYLVKNSKKAYTKKMISNSSLLTIIVFITGIVLAFILKMPFNNPYVLIKIFGLLAFTGLSVTAFMPRRRKNTALIMMVVTFIIFTYIMLVSST